MGKREYKNFIEDIEDRASNKLFYKFVIVLFAFYMFLLICNQAFYSNFSYLTIFGTSMQNTLNPYPRKVTTQNGREESWQDGVYVRLSQNVDYGDIVIIQSDGISAHDSIIKRVLGKEGDYITIAKIDVEGVEGGEYRFMRVRADSGGVVEVLYEDYIRSYTEWTANEYHTGQITDANGIVYERNFYNYYTLSYPSKKFKVNELDGKEVTFFQVPENHIFFMGDNRANSTDARFIGTKSTDKILGYVVEIIRDGSNYEGNNDWWKNRFVGFAKICYKEVLRFFGANV